MQFAYLSESVTIKKISETGTDGVFEIEGLYSGYGITLGNTLRRVLFSSLPGAAVTQYKIKNVVHEFSTLPNVIEDVVEIGLNLKKLRFRVSADEPQTLILKIRGEKKVLALDLEPNSLVEIITPDMPIATLSGKSAELDMEIRVERGLGFVPADSQKSEKLPIGTVALDAAFSPVTKVNFSVENMRVGDRADYNRLTVSVTTDGSITPSAAMHKASNILKDHFDKVSQIEVKETELAPVFAEKKKTKKAVKAKVKKSKK
ncbi:MAG: DNA-directed RNA polymerase subunit alpha [Candidatus Harrisonbacteria bacterium RIFCSPLOWO2_02_FULL_41_11]|uniref:DNA-directed RNA polymerase subunit alpha n=1 Tax=Candidatus Harrisonbacteria bacterium RIFCSPHIGHO2_02_FULL_42_16 TaxID=1798404 RepID=A0A1G1ZIV1_9BACT|nr:MAG: DNA-directed RNA polymerase subunit alpha [Candidatus Harrisonbacteria bacterium RIFCSPHIGHO2_02_FULL_42_16]OGY66534.1 MAG: DNA-directed RNA polymerase subunit alpha [Candidatus Harrisonbacteria bacterium RIFCSPLOWO2_02_FULL_41_11]